MEGTNNSKDFAKTIKGHFMEFYDDDHIYLIDGQIVPSITSIVNVRCGDKYNSIPKYVLRKAAQKGIAVHEAIEHYCKTGEESDLPELQGFKSLQRLYCFKVKENEVPVILWHDDKPIAAGRLDMVLQMDNKIGGADIKRTQKLDKKYLELQLNLYRIAYRQSYDIEWEFLKGIHVRDDLKELVDIPINEPMAWHLIKEWEEQNEQNDTDRPGNEGT